MNWSILIVDDEPMTCDLLRLMLERADFKVYEANNGPDALNSVRQQKPDLMILDVMMPDMDGYEVCQTLRAQEETVDLPVIMLSAKAQPAAVRAGLGAGATKYLSKPISRKELIGHIRGILEPATV